MPPLRLSNREKNLSIITIGFVIFYVFYQFLLTPKIDEIQKLKDKAQKVRLELRVSKEKVKIIEAMEKRLELLPEGLTASKEEKSLEMLKSISLATSKSKLNLISIRPIIKEGEAGLSFFLACTGTYQHLYTFLRIIRDLGILVVVDSMEITGGGVKNPVLDMKITLSTVE